MAVTFRSLASSSSGCCYHLSAPGAYPLLIECGIPVRQIQEGLNFNVSALAGCLVSHAHGDHSRAVAGLLRLGVAVWMSAETYAALPAEARGQKRLLTPGSCQAVGLWSVTPFDAVHDEPGTLGFVIDGHGARCLYLTDSAYSKHRFEGLTHIFIECNHSSELMRESVRSGRVDPIRYARTAQTHMSVERLLQMLRANDLSRLQEVHLLHLSNANSDERAFKEAVQRVAGVPVFVAEA